MVKKRLAALFIIVVTVLSLAACHNDSSESQDITFQEEEQSPWVYVSETLDWGVELEPYTNIQYKGIFQGNILGIYSSSGVRGSVHELYIKNFYGDEETRIVTYITPLAHNVLDVYMTEEGEFLFLMSEATFYTDESIEVDYTYYLSFVDKEGQEQKQISLDEVMEKLESAYGEAYLYEGNMAVDAAGNIYICCEKSVFVLNSEGQILAEMTADAYVLEMTVSEEGNVCVIYVDGNFVAAQITPEWELVKILETLEKVSDMHILENGDMTYYDDRGVRYYTKETESYSQLFDWTDLNLVPKELKKFVYIDEETILLSYRMASDNYKNVVDIVHRVDRSQVKEKTVLTVAAFSIASSDIQKDVAAFNMKSEEYRIEIKPYLDYTLYKKEDYEQMESNAIVRFFADLTGENPPDIILVEDYYMDMDSLIDNGLLENLVPYFEQAGWTKDDFVEGIYNLFEIEDNIYVMPDTFSVETVFADAAVVGNRMGWTLSEALEIMESLPEHIQFFERSRTSMFFSLLNYGYKQYVDIEKGTCNFETENFQNMLEFAADFPERLDYHDEEPSTPVKIQQGELVAVEQSLYNLQDLQLILAMFGEKEEVAVGMPGRGGNGAMLTPKGSLYGICSQSANKEGAAEFILSTFHTEMPDENGYYGFSVLKNVLEMQLRSDMKEYYALNEEGELVLDENGEPFSRINSSVSFGDDWSYTFRACNEEEYNLFMDILDGAQYDTTELVNQDILAIITEEAESFFAGQKTAAEVASIIQNRVSLYLSENKQ